MGEEWVPVMLGGLIRPPSELKRLAADSDSDSDATVPMADLVADCKSSLFSILPPEQSAPSRPAPAPLAPVPPISDTGLSKAARSSSSPPRCLPAQQHKEQGQSETATPTSDSGP